MNLSDKKRLTQKIEMACRYQNLKNKDASDTLLGILNGMEHARIWADKNGVKMDVNSFYHYVVLKIKESPRADVGDTLKVFSGITKLAHKIHLEEDQNSI